MWITWDPHGTRCAVTRCTQRRLLRVYVWYRGIHRKVLHFSRANDWRMQLTSLASGRSVAPRRKQAQRHAPRWIPPRVIQAWFGCFDASPMVPVQIPIPGSSSAALLARRLRRRRLHGRSVCWRVGLVRHCSHLSAATASVWTPRSACAVCLDSHLRSVRRSTGLLCLCRAARRVSLLAPAVPPCRRSVHSSRRRCVSLGSVCICDVAQ